MKIGIFTWYYGANYGAKVQAYALQQVLRKMGNEVFLIDYKVKKYKRINFKTCVDSKKDIFYPAKLYKEIHKYLRFEQFSKKYYHESKKIVDISDIDNLGFDCIVFGSDAIFNMDHPFFKQVNYGVGVNHIRKISYAPSCEYLPPDTRLPCEIICSLQEFYALSVRDMATSTLIKNSTNLEPIKVLDPTFLYDFNEFKLSYNIEYNYILVYSFSEWNEVGSSIRNYANTYNLKIISVGRDCLWADESYIDSSVEDWVSFFRNATIVFTDSFHGLAFSIKNQKQLIICSREDKHAKISDLLNEFCIKINFYSEEESVEDYLDKNFINYETILQIYRDKINMSLEYLKKSLSIDSSQYKNR